MTPRILVVGGTDTERKCAQEALGRAGYETDLVVTGQEAFEQLMAFPYDLVVTDCCLDKLACRDMVAKVRGLGVKTPILLWTHATRVADLQAIFKVTAADFVDKEGTVEALLERVGATLGGAAPVAHRTPEPSAPTVEKKNGGILVADEREGDVHALQELLPQWVHFHACANAKEGMAHAHHHKFDLVLFSVDALVTNLAGLAAQFHLLLPEGFVMAVTSPAHDEDPQATMKALRGLDFDEVLLKPFTADCVTRLVDRYCSPWDELVVVSDDVVRTSARCSRKEHYKDFVANLKARLERGVRELVDACFDSAIVDVSRAESLMPMDFAETLRRLKNIAAPLGMSLKFVAKPGMITALRKFETSFGWERLKIFPSIAEARGAKA